MKLLKGCVCCATRIRNRHPRFMRIDHTVARCGRCKIETTWEPLQEHEVVAYRNKLDKIVGALTAYA